jgi:cytochrome c-type biogenesis protein CcmH
MQLSREQVRSMREQNCASGFSQNSSIVMHAQRASWAALQVVSGMILLLLSVLTAFVIGAALNACRSKLNRALAATIASVTFGVYMLVGEPSLADQQGDKRMSVPSEEQALKIELATLEERVKENGADADAWSKLGSAYFKNGEFEKAAGAFRKTIELKGETEEALVGLAETLIFGNNGEITGAAKQALNSAVQRNPKSGRGRLWLAIAAEQEGKKAEAQQAYRDMLNDDLTGPLRRTVTQRLAGLSGGGGQVAAPHGGSSENAPKGHEGNIPEMVERLAERLKSKGGSLDNWLMLIRSYYVLQEEAKAQDAVAKARQQFASDPGALGAIDALIKEMTSPEKKAAEEAAASAPNDAAPAGLTLGVGGDHGSMVQGMVSRLADRLKDNKGSLEEWLQLIRSYSVLKEADKAQDAAVTARGKFASDAKALERIDALLEEVKLAPFAAKAGTPKS